MKHLASGRGIFVELILDSPQKEGNITQKILRHAQDQFDHIILLLKIEVSLNLIHFF